MLMPEIIRNIPITVVGSKLDVDLKNTGRRSVEVFDCDRVPTDSRILEYISEKIRNADSGSEFASKAAHLSGLPQEVLANIIFSSGYGLIVSKTGDDIVGHLAFQTREGALHAFSIVNAGSPQNIKSMFFSFIDYAREKGISTVRFGAGGDIRISEFLESASKLEKTQAMYGIKILKDGWIQIKDSQ
jgi:hypothetical protein